MRHSWDWITTNGIVTPTNKHTNAHMGIHRSTEAHVFRSLHLQLTPRGQETGCHSRPHKANYPIKMNQIN